jgi:predicted GNAT family acetyltransferase
MKKKRPNLAACMVDQNKIIVKHDQAAGEFFVDLNLLDLGNDKAVLQYRMINENSVDFYQTFVPRLARGKGIAEALVEQGLAWAKAQNYEQHASCWYVQKRLSAS